MSMRWRFWEFELVGLDWIGLYHVSGMLSTLIIEAFGLDTAVSRAGFGHSALIIPPFTLINRIFL
jgi:hypothetical protein